MSRKICVITGTRAEYGLLYWTMKQIQESADLELQICVTGMHLAPEFGLTYAKATVWGIQIPFNPVIWCAYSVLLNHCRVFTG